MDATIPGITATYLPQTLIHSCKPSLRTSTALPQATAITEAMMISRPQSCVVVALALLVLACATATGECWPLRRLAAGGDAA